MNTNIDRGRVKSILESAGSRMISVRFLKKNGEERKLTGQLKVNKYLKGGVNSLAGKEDLVTIYDVNAKGYRSFDINRLIEIKCNGITYNVVDGFVEEELIEEFEASLEKFSRKFVEEIRKSFYKILDETSI